MTKMIYSSQSRLNFDPKQLLSIGVTRVYATPFDASNCEFLDNEQILANLAGLKVKAEECADTGLEVYPLIHSINNPEGNYLIPDKYRTERDLKGVKKNDFVCIYDAFRQKEILDQVRLVAELGFERILFDDDIRDAFCYCDEHLYGYEPFRGKVIEEIAAILNGVLTAPEHEYIRLGWYEYKYARMCEFAILIEETVHNINPACRIGICNSAKRCQDFSGRKAYEWAKLFHTEQAPIFVRLCGECYEDKVMSLAQSVGWHQYYNSVFPTGVERMLELTSVPSVSYRSPGTVMFEFAAVQSVTDTNSVLWCWTEEFIPTELDRQIIKETPRIQNLEKYTRGLIPSSPLCVYIGENLGAYTPPDIVIPYGATHDNLEAYKMIALSGVPITALPDIPEGQPAVICGSYISRDMIEKIDQYVVSGGKVILDAISAKCYRLYGGTVDFEISDPHSLNFYEYDLNGGKYKFVRHCPPLSIYNIESHDAASFYKTYDINGKLTGCSVACLSCGKGKIVVMGYDLSLIGSKIVSAQWQQRVLDILQIMDIPQPLHWHGSPLVQVVTYDNPDIVTVINYNTNEVEGVLADRNGYKKEVSIKPLSVLNLDLCRSK